MKKARKWLDAAGIAYRFHDFRKDGLAPDIVAAMLAAVGAEKLVNKRGNTWRILDPATAGRWGLARPNRPPWRPAATLPNRFALLRRRRQSAKGVEGGFDARLMGGVGHRHGLARDAGRTALQALGELGRRRQIVMGHQRVPEGQ